ncbi:hypothetical protein ACIQ34_13595 [Ureibacillus sp. NPDC094379]
MKTCFIVCPIGADDSPQRKRSDKVLKHIIEPICEILDFNVVRVDKLNTVDKIDNTIVQHLEKSDLVIADMTDHNPNAFYEIGYRHALNKPLILIKDESTQIPFDLASLRTISYLLTDLDKVDATKERLKETIESFNIQVETEDSTNPNTPRTEAQSAIPFLLNIQDSIEELKELINVRNNEAFEQTLDLVVGQIQKNTPSKPEDRAMEMFLAKAIENPDQLDKFMKLADKYSVKKPIGRR